ncbi:hypothetical protein BDD21_5574 [Thiocapsa rosea]|uniref:Uncharacterized protein n=1 Tax=Thiocapsa rosea TaxID=69360 RepID=A0A495UPT6_9GAMM|nr:hypothetical protein BDD21_5574 [Thiocapsa rosea]
MHRQSSKSRTHRLLILLLLGSLWTLVWSLASVLAPSLARETLPSLQARLKPIGIGLGDVAFSDLRITGESCVARESVRGLLRPDGLAPWRRPVLMPTGGRSALLASRERARRSLPTRRTRRKSVTERDEPPGCY